MDMHTENSGNKQNRNGLSYPLEKVRFDIPLDVRAAREVAAMLVYPDGVESDTHWQKTSFVLLTAVILHVLYAEPDKTLHGVAAYLGNITDINAAFEKMMRVEHDPYGRFNWTDKQGRPVKVHPFIIQAAQDMSNRSEAENSAILATTNHYLKLYLDHSISST
ncbi:type IV secretory system conjugative DNA transfer family protein [Acidithiobacillus thiooxidans]|nr:type IV secretory system conjugative DNA transfer family protein [Acidithiobacillus thiooxidans]